MNIKLISGLELNTNLSIIRFLCILLILIQFIVFDSFAQNISKNKVAKETEYYKTFPKKLQKQIQPLLKDMILIPGGTFEMGRSLKGICTDENDSNLIIPQNPRNVTVSPFLLMQS
ncbi:MAG: hypothetical protein HOD63_12850 [Bacteroidetes bacterium]|jgi:formylglycine-generating enzyme required for sulfatase activity|nr:hypothetical protein [Bacteroidota bacterium]MBT5529509.1 hypothetical protein [Cytophagia bacterium]MBT3423938.1 hypothetical protein [Bacteroidota bacterium]MBT3802418.1 hypothetical protein [Bacteroidota bacterium]MBT3934937.1 hypothetical protein [Bacteroidota bacterium]